MIPGLEDYIETLKSIDLASLNSKIDYSRVVDAHTHPFFVGFDRRNRLSTRQFRALISEVGGIVGIASFIYSTFSFLKYLSPVGGFSLDGLLNSLNEKGNMGIANSPASGKLCFAQDCPVDEEGHSIKNPDFLHDNELLIECAEAFNEKYEKSGKTIYVGLSINPMRKDAIQTLERLRNRSRYVVALKILPNYLRIHPSSDEAIALYKAAKALRMEVVVHSMHEFALITPDECQPFGDPRYLMRALSEDIDIRVAHFWAQHGQFDAMVSMIMAKGMDNLYVDIAGSKTKFIEPVYTLKLFKLANESDIVRRKVIFGTDNPVASNPECFRDFMPEESYQMIVKEKDETKKSVLLALALGMPAQCLYNWHDKYLKTK